MNNDKNTKAKYLLKDITFAGENAHLAYTLNSLGGNAIEDNEPIILKAKEDFENLSEEQKNQLEEIKQIEKSWKEKLNIIQESLRSYLKNMNPDKYYYDSDVCVEDIDDTNIYFEIEWNKLYRISYTFQDNKATFSGEPIRVVKTPNYIDLQQEDQVEKSNKNKTTKEETVKMAGEKSGESLVEVQKKLDKMEELLKAQETRATEAEKALEQADIEKAKSGITEVVKSWEHVDKQDELVEALYKSENIDVLLGYINSINEKYAEIKKSVTEEQGKDGELAPSMSKSQMEHERVKKALETINKGRKKAK